MYSVPLAFVRVHQMAPPWTVVTTSSCSLLLIYRPRKVERLSWPRWLTVSCRSSAGQGMFASQRSMFHRWAMEPDVSSVHPYTSFRKQGECWVHHCSETWFCKAVISGRLSVGTRQCSYIWRTNQTGCLNAILLEQFQFSSTKATSCTSQPSVMNFWRKRIRDPAQEHTLCCLRLHTKELQSAYFCWNLTRFACI